MSTRQIAAVVAALGIGAGAFGWSQSADDSTAAQDTSGIQQAEEAPAAPARRRVVRLVLPWSALQDLTPRQEAEIRQIRAEILDRKDELDREERERIMALLTDAQRERVAEVEAERQRLARERAERARETRRNRDNGDGDGDDGDDDQ